MKNKLFVGNLSFKTTEDELSRFFAESGTVISVAIPTDRDTGKKRGFGFVEMETEEQAEKAINACNGQTLDGRQIIVNASRPREEAEALAGAVAMVGDAINLLIS